MESILVVPGSTGSIIFGIGLVVGCLPVAARRDDESQEGLLVLQRLGMLLHGVQSFLGILQVRLEKAANAISQSFVGKVRLIKDVSTFIGRLSNGSHQFVVERLITDNIEFFLIM